MKHYALKALATAIFGLLALSGYAQEKTHWSTTTAYSQSHHSAISTNLITWGWFGTANAELSTAIAKKVVLFAGGRYNGWSFNNNSYEEPVLQQQATVNAGIKWYQWYNYSGLFFGFKTQYEAYRMGGFLHKDYTEEGDAFGLGAGVGYSIMLWKNCNLDLGLWGWGGMTSYEKFSREYKGKSIEKDVRAFFTPDDVLVSLVYVF